MESLKNLKIIIATFNRKNNLKTLLTQIDEQINHSFNVCTIVVNDGSTDGTREMISKFFPDVIIITGTGNWWWTKCMNEGFKKAIELESDFVLIMNDDNEIMPDYLKQLWDDYSTLPENSILGSMSISIENSGLIEMSGTKSFNRFSLKTRQYITPFSSLLESHTGIYPTYTLCGRGTLIPCGIFQQIGFYSDHLLQYGSDDEFILRARKNNIPTFISWNLKVYNNSYMTSESSSIKKTTFWNYTRNFFKEHTANSIKKEIYIYYKYGTPIFLPFHIIYYILGSYKSFFLNYNHLKKN